MKAKKSAPVWAALAPSLIEAIRLARYLGGMGMDEAAFGAVERAIRGSMTAEQCVRIERLCAPNRGEQGAGGADR